MVKTTNNFIAYMSPHKCRCKEAILHSIGMSRHHRTKSEKQMTSKSEKNANFAWNFKLFKAKCSFVLLSCITISLSRSAIVVVVFDEKKRWRKRRSKNTVEQMKCMRNTCSWIYLFLTSYQTKLFLLFLIYFWNARSTIFLLIFIEIVVNLT